MFASIGREEVADFRVERSAILWLEVAFFRWNVKVLIRLVEAWSLL